MKPNRLAIALLLAAPVASAEFKNTSYSFFSAGAEYVSYAEHLDDFGGQTVDSSYSAVNMVQRSGGYTAVNDKLGFFIKTASTLIANEETEEWEADGLSGSIQKDVAAMNFQMLDIMLAYHMGNGGYWLGGVHYQKISFSRFGWENTSQTDAFAQLVEDDMRADASLMAQITDLVNSGTAVDSAGNVITTVDQYFEAIRFDPEQTSDVVFEDASNFSITGGYEYDSYFVNQAKGLRYTYGGRLGLAVYENLLNSGRETAMTRSFGGGVDLHLSAGIGYQFTPEIGTLLMAEGNATWRDEITEKLSDGESQRTVSLPENTFYAVSLTASVFWNF